MTSTKQFVWCDNDRCEQRDVSSITTAQFFVYGQTISGTKYFYELDHIGSIRELVDNGGTKQAEYAYNAFGIISKFSESVPSDFRFAGYYLHPRSGFSITRTRSYSDTLGRFVSRDILEEDSGEANSFIYVLNNPISFVDLLGLQQSAPPGVSGTEGLNQQVTNETLTDYSMTDGGRTQNFTWGKKRNACIVNGNLVDKETGAIILRGAHAGAMGKLNVPKCVDECDDPRKKVEGKILPSSGGGK